MSLFNLIALFTTIFVLFYTYFLRKYNYWKRKGVPYIQPRFPFGTIENPFSVKKHIAIKLKEQYDYLKSQGHKHGGLYFFTKISYVPIDPEYIKNIMSKDFNYFTDRGNYYNERDAPLSANLLNIERHKWKNLRFKLTPTFTSGKMKTMFPTLVACSEPLKLALGNVAEKGEEVDIKELSACFTTDVIGSCAFGIDCNSFKNADNEFRKNSNKIFAHLSKLKLLGFIIATGNPPLGRFLRITFCSKDIYEFFFNIVKQTVSYREKTNSTRQDFMQLLINLKNDKLIQGEKSDQSNVRNAKNFTMQEVATQSFVFFLAGFETSSSAMTFCLFELAHNQEVQNKLRNEINEVLSANQEQLTYDLVMGMKYLGQVVDETLRKYPIAPVLSCVCVADYKMPNTDVVIEKGTRVMIPVYALHHDDEYFPNPEQFDPDRFADGNKQKIRPFTYLPFGEGPRNCIGARFGLMQTKLGLAVLLKNFKFTLNDKTPYPISINPFMFGNLLTPLEKIYLNVERVV